MSTYFRVSRSLLVAMLLGRTAFAQIPAQSPDPAPPTHPTNDAPSAEAPSELPSARQAAGQDSPQASASPAPTALPAIPPSAGPASAAPPPTAAPPPARATTVEPVSKHRLAWRYPRFRWWEYVGAGAVTAGNVAMEMLYQAQPRERWRTPVLFDGAVRGWLRAQDKAWEQTATHVGDYTWYATQWYVLLDGLFTPLVTDKLNTDVALQLTLLNWQTVGLTGLLSRLSHVAVGRTRPSLQGCSDVPASANPCEFRGASFFSGHAAMTTVSAALGCMNHVHLPLYGGGVADAAVCPVLLTAAGTVGVLRIVNDKHWVTDVLAGWALGGTIGFGLPWALHYSPAAVRVALNPRPNVAVIPWAAPSSGGLQVLGIL